MSGKGNPRGWRVAVDRGGTFTDIVAWAPDGHLHAHKVLSAGGPAGVDPALVGIGELLARVAPGDGQSVPAIEWLRVGTTVATNALLERKGERTLLVTTRGFADALRIGYQQRPDIFAREIRLRPPLHAGVIEADERIDAAGRVLLELDVPSLGHALRAAKGAAYESVAICFLHAVLNPTHELEAGRLARAAGFAEVTLSHAVAALQGYVARGDTAVADAYLTPVLLRYVRGLERSLTSRRQQPVVSYMQSHGGLVDGAGFRGINGLLSGPAGGVIGMIAAGAASGTPRRLIGFDMGGTSTDVSIFAGELPRRMSSELDGVRLQAAMMDVQTIAAGGGSIVRYRDGRLQVGPDSAGAVPGPACYRRGGPATLTDCNLVLGRVQPELFPAVFGRDGTETLDVAAARDRLSALVADIGRDGQFDYTVESLAAACVAIADAAMANAIRELSLRHGADAATFALVCFGGAGGQHACAIAERLGIGSIVLHPLSGVLSAFGIGLARRRSIVRRSVERALDDSGLASAERLLQDLGRHTEYELERQGVARDAIRLRRTAALRLPGSDTSLDVDWTDAGSMRAEFAAGHERLYGVRTAARDLVITAVCVEATEVTATADQPSSPLPVSEPRGGREERTARVWLDGAAIPVPAVERFALRAGESLKGPRLVADQGATVWIAPGWRGSVGGDGTLLLEHDAANAQPREDAARGADPQRLEVFNGLFMHVAEQMGAVLRQTASSVNIKERLDFSCALFTADAQLVANAPHMPVHLGSMGASVAAVVSTFPDLEPGDSYLLNSPYAGGTHLPDLTVVTPVFDESQRTLTAFVASRAHHADIGGVTPGSMPPWSRTIDDEGTLLEPMRIVRDGILDEPALRARLGAGPHPARDPERNLADLRAQLAANARGMRELRRARSEFGSDVVAAFMTHVQDNAERCMRRAIGNLRNGEFRYELDNGQAIAVRIAVDAASGSAIVDFDGTSAQVDNNFNAPRAVAVAAVLYVFRTLIDEPIPLNAGCLRPLEIRIPHGSLLDPTWPSAVVAGNVETSQCIVDALYGALGLQAAAQGTMNNLTFGNERHQYYETIAGGAGAGPGYDGASGVQTHMTNSRLTDPEILEQRFPVLLREFALRRGSGGRGRQRGGDGVVRSIEFREAMTVAILSNHRRVAPFGLAGGEPGAPGANRVVRRDGRAESLPGCVQIAVEPGDVVTLETPGGGGYGEPEQR